MTEQLANTLRAGCEQLGLALTEQQEKQLLSYVYELEKWNATYNLTAIRDVDSMMKRHVLDALSIVNSVAVYQPKTLADIGTGGGVPGIILAILFPDLHVYLVESIGKKCRFLRHVISVLSLQNNVSVMQQRVEEWEVDLPLSMIVCRAFSSLKNFTTITRHLGDQKTVWLAMKADNVKTEIEQLDEAFSISQDIVLTVPYEKAKRHLLVLKKG